MLGARGGEGAVSEKFGDGTWLAHRQLMHLSPKFTNSASLPPLISSTLKKIEIFHTVGGGRGGA